ncbi:MAG: hypothetical protein S4CHLAM102_15770 [Chlamydiia bacterium]|nr:hypothetical protein [Chlamydiia bacterium]
MVNLRYLRFIICLAVFLLAHVEGVGQARDLTVAVFVGRGKELVGRDGTEKANRVVAFERKVHEEIRKFCEAMAGNKKVTFLLSHSHQEIREGRGHASVEDAYEAQGYAGVFLFYADKNQLKLASTEVTFYRSDEKKAVGKEFDYLSRETNQQVIKSQLICVFPGGGDVLVQLALASYLHAGLSRTSTQNKQILVYDGEHYWEGFYRQLSSLQSYGYRAKPDIVMYRSATEMAQRVTVVSQENKYDQRDPRYIKRYKEFEKKQ